MADLISTAPKSNAGFSLIDTGTLRTDLASRREVKYAFTDLDVAKLRQNLRLNCQQLVHNEKISVVRSIYFDDVNLSACFANLDGVGIRKKLRVRWYDSLEPQNDFFLEIKWRDSRVTGKHRYQIKSKQPLIDVPYRQVFQQLQRIVPDEILREILTYTEPIVIVEYKREHFASDDGIRITLDYDLAFYDQTGKSRISTSFRRSHDRLSVLEGKTPVGRESELKKWLHPFSPRVGRCSKYVNGCIQIGLISTHEQ